MKETSYPDFPLVSSFTQLADAFILSLVTDIQALLPTFFSLTVHIKRSNASLSFLFTNRRSQNKHLYAVSQIYSVVTLFSCQLQCSQILACLSAFKYTQHAGPPPPSSPPYPQCTSRMLNMAAVAASESLDCVSWGTGKLSPGSS